MKKLIYISNLRLPTEKAYGIQIAEMCSAFAGFGLDVSLVSPYRKNPRTDFFEYYGVESNFKFKIVFAPDFYLPGPLDKPAVAFKNFVSGILLTFHGLISGADIIYSRDEWPIYFLSFFKKNIVFEAHKFSDARRMFYRRFLKENIKIVTISDNLKKKFINIGFSPDNVVVAHDGVDLKDFDVQISKEEARNKLNLPRDSKIVMYTGHLFEWKGATTLLNTAKSITNKILFVFVGGTDHDIYEFKKKAEGLGNVLILGHKPHKDIPLFLKAADILVLPNSAKDKMYLDTSPIKLFEYMASGRPIVASDLPSIKEILNKENSVIVVPDNPNSLAEGIGSLINDEELAKNISSRSFKDVHDYTWQKRAEKIINFMK